MRTYNYLSNELPRELIGVYDDLEQDLLRIIVKQLKMGISPAKVTQNIQDKVAEYNPKIEKVISIIFADMKKKAVNDGKTDFKKETEDKEPVTNDEANKLIASKLMGAFTLSKVINQRLMDSALNEYTRDYFYLQSPETRLSRKEKRFDAITKNLAKGLKIEKKGKLRSLDGLIKDELMYEVTQANADVNMQNFKNSSARFIEVSSHPTARTWTPYMKHEYEDHSSWQGQVYYSGEPVDGYEEFESTCGYGEMLGICGINCYHQFQMNYSGTGEQKEYSIKDVRKGYEASQQQRAYERAIRKLKQARAVYEEAGDNDMTNKLNKNIQTATSKLKTFCDANKLKYVNWRTQI